MHSNVETLRWRFPFLPLLHWLERSPECHALHLEFRHWQRSTVSSLESLEGHDYLLLLPLSARNGLLGSVFQQLKSSPVTF